MSGRRDDEKKSNVGAMVGLGAVASCVGGFVFRNFHVVPANKFIAKTGFLVKDVSVSRKTLRLPFQAVRYYDMHPQTYKFVGKNIMSKELIGFELPVKFNIAPIHPEKNLPGFINYVTRVGAMTPEEKHDLVENIIIGKTREYTSNMTIQEIVENKDMFKKGVVKHVEGELAENGFEATSANISDIEDPPGVDYFKNLMRKATSEANTTSSIAVAEAEKTRIIGEKNRQVETRQQEATMEAQAKETESLQSQNVSQYERDLEIMRINNKKQEELSKIEAHKATELRGIEVESELNLHRQQQELERLRSGKVVLATAEAEAVLKKAQMEADAIKIKAEAEAAAVKIRADAHLYDQTQHAEADLISQSKKAEANLFEKNRIAEAIKLLAEADRVKQLREAEAYLVTKDKEAEAIKLLAEGDLVKQAKEAEGVKLLAEAQLVAKTKEAEGTQTFLEAQAKGLQEFYGAANENPALASLYLLIKEGKVYDKDGLFDRLGEHAAKSINGLQPKIHIWNTGSDQDSSENYTKVISGLAKVTPPILDALQQQTGIKLPDWLPQANSSKE